MSQYIYDQLSSGQTVEVELLYPLATYNSRSKAFYLRSEIDEDFWNAMRALEREGLRLRAVIQIQPDDEGANVQASTPDESAKANSGPQDAKNVAPAKGKKPPKSTGPYGKFWQELWAKGFFNQLILQDWLASYAANGANKLPMDEQIRQIFGVTSRTFISPEMLMERLDIDLPVQAFAGLEVTIKRAAGLEMMPEITDEEIPF